MRDRLLVVWATAWWWLTWPSRAVEGLVTRRIQAERDRLVRDIAARRQAAEVAALVRTVGALAGRVEELDAERAGGTAAWQTAPITGLLRRMQSVEIDVAANTEGIREVARIAKELPAQRIRLHEAQVHGLATPTPRTTTTADGVEIKE